MATHTKAEVEPAVDHAAAEAAGGGAGGAAGSGGPDFLNAVGVLGQGLPAPSFTVVAADMKNSSFMVMRPYVVVVGYGEVAVGGERTGYTFGDTVWCNVSKEADGFDGEGGAAFTWTASLSTEEDDDAELSVKIAEIPAWTHVFRMGGVQQYHSGAIVVASPKVKSIDVVTAIEDASTSDSTLKMKYWTRAVNVVVLDDSDDSDSSSSHSVTIADWTEITYVTGSVYDPGTHQFRNRTRIVKAIVDEDDASSSSVSVFTAEPVCGGE